MGTTLKDLIGNHVVAVHRLIYKVSGGRVGSGLAGMPVLEMTTKGRKSGKTRTVMLTAPIRYQGNMVIVASRGGDDRPPSWYLNLKDDPKVEVTTGGTSATMTARVLTAAEREEQWPKVVAAYKGYGNYQTKTDRTIPLIVLEP
jgi:deazaflavin-dependent oxidoreductase (nitroreductase family)